MDAQRTQTIIDNRTSDLPASFDDTRERLNLILAANAEIEREKETYKDFREQIEASLLKHPLNAEKTFSYFGLLLGTFPPAAIFLQIFKNNIEPGMVALLIFVNLVCAAAGYFSGKLIAKMVLPAEKYSWTKMILFLPFIGILWGIMAGGSGGIFIFGIGAIFGAIIAAMVGSAAITAFTIFHRVLKRGEMIERSQFLALAFGITLTISAFILGL